MQTQDVYRSKSETRRSRHVLQQLGGVPAGRLGASTRRRHSLILGRRRSRRGSKHIGLGQGAALLAEGRASEVGGTSGPRFPPLAPAACRPHLDVHQGAKCDQQQQAGAHCGAGSRGAGARVHRSCCCCCCWRLRRHREPLADHNARVLALRSPRSCAAWALVPAAAAVAAATDPSYEPPAVLAMPASVHACHR